MIVFLDSGVLHTLISDSKVKEVIDCQNWFYYLLSRSALVVTSAICNYEVKRELIRRTNTKEINNLSQLKSLIDSLSIDEQTLELAAKYPGRYVVIATTNVKHLSRFTEAKEWQDINF